MARRNRFAPPGYWLHLTQRGNYRQTVFSSDADREHFLSLLETHSEERGVRIAAYTLMSNHFHLVVAGDRPDAVSLFMMNVNGQYSAYRHAAQKLRGHLWQGRFFFCVLDDDHWANALNRLQLPGLRQRDHFFVHGQDVRGDKYLLADCYSRPVQKLSPEAVEYFLHASDSRIRHYKWLLVEDWGGEIAFSYFLRCSLRGPTLFVEIKRFLLTPLRASLREVDTLAPLGFSATLSRLFVVAPLAALFRLIAAPFAVLGYLGKGWEHLWGAPERQRRKLIDANPLYDYGASTSVRQNFASGEYMHYFQRADSDYYQKMLEKEILDTLIEFLDVHQVDTSDLRERQSTILNNGVIVQGGNIETGSLAVGDGARSFQKTVRKAVGKAKAAAVGAAS